MKVDSAVKVLVVDDEDSSLSLMERLLTRLKFNVFKARNGEEALSKLSSVAADIVITDVRMPIMDGLILLEEIKIRYPDIFVVLLTGAGTIEDAVKAMKKGAYDYILKPFKIEEIKRVLEKIMSHQKILEKTVSLETDHRKKHRFENIIGQDSKMFEIFQRIMDVAKTRATVLITGETGTGKELIAAAIHYNSLRKESPFIRVNCAALPENLVKSELFGHVKGAFTGAVKDKEGHFERAHSGTIFLDEIGDISLETQISLLRVLDLGTFHRVGGARTKKVDARLICATNKDLFEKVKEMTFREDLYYRLNVVSIHLPPLRERKSDIPLLATYFLKRYSAETHKNFRGFSKKAMEILIRYGWPGNVRELANVIENAVIFGKNREIGPNDLSNEIGEETLNNNFNLSLSSRSLSSAESTLIKEVLVETDWNLKQAASQLEIARGTLYSKMKKYGIEKSV